MQLNALAIYDAHGNRRIVRFGPGLNVVTGWSGTGKSSLLDITEYCLGRTHPTYPAGVLTRVVEWFAAEVEHDGRTVVIARPKPTSSAASVSTAVLLHGASLDEVDTSALQPNSDADLIRTELTRLVGVPENVVTAGGLLRPPLQATIAQALLLCFQGQSEIASKDLLFHRTHEDEVRRALRDTLPFFVGAVDADTVRMRRQLDDYRRELRVATARLERSRAMTNSATEATSALLAEAAVLGLAANVPANTGPIDLLQLIADGGRPEASLVAPPQSDVTEPLRARQRELRTQLEQLDHRLRVLRRASDERQAYSAEVSEQQTRLSSIGLLPPGHQGEEGSCPLCGQETEDAGANTRDVRALLAELTRRLADVREVEPRIELLTSETESAARQLRDELRQVTNDLEAAIRANAELTRATDLESRRDFLRGRITQFLGAVSPSTDVANLESEVSRLTTLIVGLEDRLEGLSLQERTDSILRVISQDLTNLSRTLELEHSEHAINLDAGRLTLVADTRDGPIAMNRMGSAANLIGYHVAAHLALHRWFVEQTLPVPNFLFLDQPSQAFFPDDVSGPEDEVLSDEDRERVADLYRLIVQVTQQLGLRLQVIVTDHANLDISWFQEAVRENWRHGEALVPASWLD